MKFNDNLIDILKNFSNINQSVEIKPGNVIRTINPIKSVMASAKSEEEFPAEARIYDLSKFLSVLSIFEDPDVQFGEFGFDIVENRKKTHFMYADKSMIITPPEKDLNIPTPDAEASVTWAELDSVIKAAGVLGLPEIAFVGENGKVYIRSVDTERGNKDSYDVEVGETNDEFIFVFKRDNLKLLPKDYVVSISSKGISKFESDEVTYYVAVETNSSKFKKGE